MVSSRHISDPTEGSSAMSASTAGTTSVIRLLVRPLVVVTALERALALRARMF